ncbi:MAG TPA: ATP-binding protein, partial [Rugosimonospora sp.]|nr:ATP-binding protein [Rugosimonospora sp.]
MATDGAEQPKSTGEPVERARAGIRGWVRAAGRRTGAGLRAASPYAILAFLTASAVAPVAAVGLGAGEFAAVLNQLGNVGGNYLADVLAATVGRMREGGPVSEQRWRDEVAGALAPLLAAGDEQSRELRAEVGRLLRGVDAVGTALAASAEADDALRDELAAAFQALGAGVGELHWMLVDTRIALDGLQQQLAIQSLALHQQLDAVRQHLVTFAQLRHTPVVPGPPGALALPGALPCPYPGLASFQPEDAPWFRGREEYVARLLGRLAEHAVGGPPLVLTGVSGVGKSSLLRAGLLPAIAAGGLGEAATGWHWLLMTPGSAPLAELVPRLEALAGAAAEPSTVELVRTGPERLGRLAARAAARGHRPVLVVDQFEELFTQCPDRDEQLAFAAALAGAGPALVVIAVRADFYAACTQLPPLSEVLSAGHVVLDALDTAALHRAVVEPAARAGL